MLSLPNVTLVAVETLCHELASATIADCTGEIEFGEVLIYTDDPAKIKIQGASVRVVPNWPTKEEYMHFFHCDACDPVKTDFVLFLEWDAGLCDVQMWSDRFFDYDYIGAPWWYTDGSQNVGNGGFSLRTMRLQRFIKDKQDKYPALTDNQLCRDYGAQIQAEGGFKWAPVPMANDFALEGFDRLGLPNNLEHFGFHGSINWRLILPREELLRRYRLMLENEYIMTKTARAGDLLRAEPWLQAA